MQELNEKIKVNLRCGIYEIFISPQLLMNLTLNEGTLFQNPGWYLLVLPLVHHFLCKGMLIYLEV